MVNAEETTGITKYVESREERNCSGINDLKFRIRVPLMAI
jgi:hypothetical protein